MDCTQISSDGATPGTFPYSLEEGETRGRIFPSIRAAQSAWLPAHSQKWVSVNTLRHGLIVIQPKAAIRDGLGLLAVNGLTEVQPDRPFRIFMSSFGIRKHRRPKRELIALALPDPTVALPTQLPKSDLLGVSLESDIKRSGDHLGSAIQLAPERADERSPLTESLNVEHVFVLYRNRLRDMLGKYCSI